MSAVTTARAREVAGPYIDAVGSDVRLRAAAQWRRTWDRVWSARIAIVIGVVVAILTWPSTSRWVVLSAADRSWVAALQVISHDGIGFGGVVFSYGPLGFLGTPALLLPLQGVLSLAVEGALWLGLAVATSVQLRRFLGTVSTALLAFAVFAVVSPLADLQVLGLIVPLVVMWCLPRLLRSGSGSPVVAAGAGAVTALLFLVKPNLGVGMLLIVGATIAARAWLDRDAPGGARLGGAFVGTMVVASLVLWLVLGQSFGDLGRWLVDTWSIAAGYGSAMGYPSASNYWQYVVAAALSGWFAWIVWTTPSLDRRHRIATTAVLGVALVYTFRLAFVRDDVSHALMFFMVLIFAPIAFCSAVRTRRGLSVCIASALALVALTNVSLRGVFDVSNGISNFSDAVAATVSSSYRGDVIADNQLLYRRAYGVPPAMRDQVDGHTVHAVPVDSGVFYAYPELHWDPLPVFEDYGAFTQRLDDRNSDVLAGSERPDYLLRAPGAALDGRLPRFEPPRQNLEILCRYHVAMASKRWQLLRAGHDRCGEIRRAGRRTTEYGKRVEVPRAEDDIVLARFDGVSSSFTSRIEALLLRAPAVFITADAEAWYRFLPGHQESWHVMSVPRCAIPQVDKLGPAFEHFTISDSKGKPTARDSFDVEFARVSYECPPAPTRLDA